jgi:hypothetical protein
LPGWYPEIGHNVFLPYPFQLFIYHSSYIRRRSLDLLSVNLKINKIHAFLISVLDICDCLASRLGRYIPRERASEPVRSLWRLEENPRSLLLRLIYLNSA